MVNNKIKVGVVGLGYWGPKVLRNFLQNEDIEVVAVCDQDEKRLQNFHHDGIRKISDFDELMRDDTVDAVALCVPVEYHYTCTKKALENNKHVWVEKPLAETAKEAAELSLLANDKNLTLFVDHTFLYNPAVQKIKEVVDSKELGEILYFDSTRINLGLIQKNINVVMDLAPHDISILNHIVKSNPISVTAQGTSVVTKKLEEIAYVLMKYENGMIAHLNFNWLSPVKIRQTIIGGTRKLLLYDDTHASEKIKIFDKGVDINKIYKESGNESALINYRVGDIVAPNIEQTESLSLACNDFVESIRTGEPPLSDGYSGVRVVQIIESIQNSLKANGQAVDLESNNKSEPVQCKQMD